MQGAGSPWAGDPVVRTPEICGCLMKVLPWEVWGDRSFQSGLKAGLAKSLFGLTVTRRGSPSP